MKVNKVKIERLGVREIMKMAERQGFEPWVPVKAQRLSKPARSTTPAPLRGGVVAAEIMAQLGMCKGFCDVLSRVEHKCHCKLLRIFLPHWRVCETMNQTHLD